jgi:hypothetical protein
MPTALYAHASCKRINSGMHTNTLIKHKEQNTDTSATKIIKMRKIEQI